MESLFERYFRLLAGQLPAAEYGVIATPVDVSGTETETETQPPRCLC